MTLQRGASPPVAGDVPWGDDPCFTEAELNALLPPIPDWMRKPPGGDKQPTLFDDLE